jgi:hypothetical protein
VGLSKGVVVRRIPRNPHGGLAPHGRRPVTPNRAKHPPPRPEPLLVTRNPYKSGGGARHPPQVPPRPAFLFVGRSFYTSGAAVSLGR